MQASFRPTQHTSVPNKSNPTSREVSWSEDRPPSGNFAKMVGCAHYELASLMSNRPIPRPVRRNPCPDESESAVPSGILNLDTFCLCRSSRSYPCRKPSSTVGRSARMTHRSGVALPDPSAHCGASHSASLSNSSHRPYDPVSSASSDSSFAFASAIASRSCR